MRQKGLKPLRLAVAVGLVCSGFAQQSWALDLMGSYQLALQNDPIFQSAVKDYEAGLQNNTIGRSAVLPKLAASYTQSKNQATQWGQAYPGGPNSAYNWSYPSNYTYLQLTQPLFSLEAFARWRQGVAQSDFSEAKFVFNTQDLLIRVLQAYTDLLFAMDQHQFLLAERDAFHEQWKVAKNMNKHGEASMIDMLEAEAAYQVANAKLVEADDAIALAKQKLVSIIGIPVENANTVVRLPNSFRLMHLPNPRFEEWKEKALEVNAEIKAATHNVEVAKQEYRKNHAGHYPVVNLVGAVTTQQSNTVASINQTTNQNYVGVQVSLPIFTGGEIYGKSSQAYSSYEKAQADLNATQERVITELRKQFDIVVTAQKKIEALTTAQESGTQLVKAMRKSTIVGERIFMDVLLAEKGLYNTRRDLAQAKYNYLVAYLKLYQQVGTLSVEQFQQVAAYFKPRQ